MTRTDAFLGRIRAAQALDFSQSFAPHALRLFPRLFTKVHRRKGGLSRLHVDF